MPPPPKAPGTRARRNRSSTAAVIKADPDLEIPPLPPHPEAEREVDWHPLAVAQWEAIWRSPMAPEFDDSDIHGMVVVTMLYHDFYTAKTARQRAELAAEIRLSGQRYGSSPLDRRRLQWEIERTEDAQQRGRRRRGADGSTPERRPDASGGDPRGILRAIK
jgi:hypothetical protein